MAFDSQWPQPPGPVSRMISLDASLYPRGIFGGWKRACCPSHGGRLARHESSPVQKSAFGPALGVIPGLGRGSGATSTTPEPQRQLLGHEHERPAACIQAAIDQPTDRVQLSAEIANGWSLMVFSTPW